MGRQSSTCSNNGATALKFKFCHQQDAAHIQIQFINLVPVGTDHRISPGSKPSTLEAIFGNIKHTSGE